MQKSNGDDPDAEGPQAEGASESYYENRTLELQCPDRATRCAPYSRLDGERIDECVGRPDPLQQSRVKAGPSGPAPASASRAHLMRLPTGILQCSECRMIAVWSNKSDTVSDVVAEAKSTQDAAHVHARSLATPLLCSKRHEPSDDRHGQLRRHCFSLWLVVSLHSCLLLYFFAALGSAFACGVPGVEIHAAKSATRLSLNRVHQTSAVVDGASTDLIRPVSFCREWTGLESFTRSQCRTSWFYQGKLVHGNLFQEHCLVSRVKRLPLF